jgi:peptidoglycan/LPS O-acetylase OafA/YrhL
MRSLVSWRGTSTHHAQRSRSAVVGGRGRTHYAVNSPEDRAWRPAGSLPYMPGLDGLRALAVIAVLLYHGGLTWLPGGFLGVEVFFVISGYLITALLLAQWRRYGRVDFKAFWLGRARRLLPALYLLLVVTLAYAVVFLPEEVAGLREDVLAALGYVTNWYLVLGQESYFEAAGRPSLLRHLWSLAVEEQFYLLWPLLLALGLSVGIAGWRRRWVLLLALFGAAASALLMALLYEPGVDPSRLYFGTDTRATGLLIGAALACAWAPWRFGVAGRGNRPAAADRLLLQRGRLGWWRRRWGWTAPLFLDLGGVTALGGLVFLCLRISEYDPVLYRGGLACVVVASAVVIMASAHPYARLGNDLLGRQPLRWIGERSYGIYLWHWPVFMVTRPQLDVPLEGPPLLALRLAITVALAELSYRYVEMPVRRGALGRAWRALRASEGPQRRRLIALWAAAAAPVVALCAALGAVASQAEPQEPPSYLRSGAAIHTKTTPGSATAGKTAVQEITSPESENPAIARRSAAADATEDLASRSSATAGEKEKAGHAGQEAAVGPVSAVGDSVMLGAAGELEKTVPNVATIDAEVGFQAADAIAVLEARRYAGELGEVVVVHIGSNGVFTAEQFDQTMGALEGVRRVVFVNVNVPRPWAQPNNEVIAEGVDRYPNAVLADWYSASADHPEYFVEDGVHLTIEGQKAYSALIAEKVEER